MKVRTMQVNPTGDAGRVSPEGCNMRYDAKRIYANPKGHSKAELVECLEILNKSVEPVALNYFQFEAISDACRRLGRQSLEDVSLELDGTDLWIRVQE